MMYSSSNYKENISQQNHKSVFVFFLSIPKVTVDIPACAHHFCDKSSINDKCNH